MSDTREIKSKKGGKREINIIYIVVLLSTAIVLSGAVP